MEKYNDSFLEKMSQVRVGDNSFYEIILNILLMILYRRLTGWKNIMIHSWKK
jgi:hypothetical protein